MTLDAKIVSALKQIIQRSNLKKKVNWKSRGLTRMPDSFVANRPRE